MLTKSRIQKAPLLSKLPADQIFMKHGKDANKLLKKPNLYSPLEKTIVLEKAFKRHTAVGLWYATIAFMAAGAVVIGGITRLTESGLSMTSWHLIKDIKRPQTEEEWEQEFARYKTFPEFDTVHMDIDLEKFKSIFFWEWAHRNWGRSIGPIYLLPYLYFHARGHFKRPGMLPWVRKSSHPLLFLLCCQGLMGWYMVKSGLDRKHLESRLDSDIARVSQYRLAAHLSMALLLLGFCFDNALKCLFKPKELIFPEANAFTQNTIDLTKKARKLKRMTPGMSIGLVAFSILSGAFVAGLDAGMIYNNWPHMADEGITHLPVDVFRHQPLWRDMLENPATVQFEHRVITHTTFLSLMALCATGFKCRSILPRSVQYSLLGVFGASWMQAGLGISALLKQCPIELCAAHQFGSVVLLSWSISLLHFLRRVPK